ncbi:leucine-rich repeat and immunoglobulin-like domain-containing nogo receptor-interacting protein 3 [Centruroides vittatus]|uniref:leucine-rich repeat and immunoglobulin-like domain-containing nogo receptor-interacting protein 3 n=1 Tax=Centruroides vittatus TaxID=120091 RepID=UPI00350FB462
MAIKEVFMYKIILFLYVSSFSVWCVWMESHNAKVSNTMTLIHIFNKTAETDKNCPIVCKCVFLQTSVNVDCIEKSLNLIPKNLPAKATRLLLNGNNIRKLDSLSESLLYLQVLDLTKNNILLIKREFSAYIPNLYSLNISSNNLNSVILENIFLNLSSLDTLNISRNRLNKLTPYLFHGLQKLKILDISYNDIETIENYTFHFMELLNYLDLTGNKLKILKHQWFQNLNKLSVLKLQQNHLQNISNLVFSTLHNLSYLDLSKNNIGSVGLLSFKGLSNLKHLNFSSNNVSSLQEGIFKSADGIEVVDFSHNPLVNIEKSFSYGHNVKFLRLVNTTLKTLSRNSLLGLSNLQQLQLSDSSKLSSVDKRALLVTTKLNDLDLSKNNLSTLPSEFIKPLKELKLIRLEGNPWKCDCHMYWILLWLQDQTEIHLKSPDETFCKYPSELNGHSLLDALDHRIVCTNATIREYSTQAHFHIGSTALLQCFVEGNPTPVLTWITPHNLVFHWSEQCCNDSDCNVTSCNVNHPSVHTTLKQSVPKDVLKRFLILQNGNLLIRNVQRQDCGFYHCVASNPMSNQTRTIHLTLDHSFLIHIKIVSILVGLAISFGFLLITLLSVFIQLILSRCGIECPCSTSPKSQQIKRILDGMEHYKRQQLERLRENYNFQVQRIKDNCMQQMEKLRESYSSQIERLRDIRDYGTLQIDRIRENYYLQVQRVRDYSASQIDRLRENYFFQRSRIRKFSAHQLYKLRENYKLQQQHFNKIFENLNIESCRNVCARTDSIIFEPEITVEPIFVTKICSLEQTPHDQTPDSGDSSSQVSAYFTPDEEGSEISQGEGETDYIKCNDILKSTREISCKIKEDQALSIPSKIKSTSKSLDFQDIKREVSQDTFPIDKSEQNESETAV